MTGTLIPSNQGKKLPVLLCAILSCLIVTAQNPIVTENLLTGNASSEWDISGAGDLSIQGFATDLSVNKGTTVRFKIDVAGAVSYTIKIYRLGYYQGNGARLITNLGSFAGIDQLPPVTDPANGLVDCGNWTESATWNVPLTAVSGIYIAKLTRSDNNGSSHIVFVVRDDASNSDLLFQTSDATWQAYNVYGNNSLYTGTTSYPSGHATKVSYNRPFYTRSGGGGSSGSEDWLFHSEYPMVRWVERNGYDVTYATNIDAARNPNLMQNHKVFLSVGHDEYWSKEQRDNITAALNSGKHLAFFSGNEVYWKTRWENSIDGTNTPFRTLVCYKEGTLGENSCGTKCDPSPEWTGLWRDGCNFPGTNGCNPENALTGQISWVGSTGAIEVPDDFKNLRFWRNTSITGLTAGQVATLSAGTLGYEWDWEQNNGLYPSGRMLLSSTTSSGKTHKLSLYKHTNGGWVFGAGTVQWSWGLDGDHDGGGSIEDGRMQQATVNLFADMTVQPGSLQAGLVPATASTDFTAPVSIINSPVHAATVYQGLPLTIIGTASDINAIGGVEVSTDGGSTWHRANGTTVWSYTWTPTTPGSFTIKSRGFDDSGNMEVSGTAPAGNAKTISVVGLPSPNEGPGGPILVISSATNPFSRYAVEILRAEGMNEFAAMHITDVTTPILNNYDVAVLGEMPLNAAQVTMLTDWVNSGGTLIAFRPDAQLSTLLGIIPAGGTLSNKYLLVNTASGPGIGIVNQTIQFHGEADQYTLNGATALATLYSDATTATAYPAVTSMDVGPNGGSAVAFTYDLSRSIVYTRQGNPAWAGQERDGEAGIRSDDMYYGNKPGDVQPDWIDLDKVAIPQADEQQRLLSNIIIKNNLHRKPLPKFWFLPRGLKAAIVMTGDDHGNGGTVGRFNQYMSMGPNTPQAVADWTAIRGTSYIYPGTPIPNAQAMAFEADGFEIALHLNTGCTNNWTPASLQADLNTQLAQLANTFPGIPTPRTNRTHCIAWSDWSSQPQIQSLFGIRLDVNYYYWPGSWVLDRPGMFTGSGMPMRFADLNGAIIDCYQVPTQMTDESGISYTPFCNSLLDKALGAEGYYGVFCANMHTDNVTSTGSDAIIASALARQVPVVSARQMLEWLDGRNNSSFSAMNWSSNILSFTITTSAINLKAMLPLSAIVGQLTSLTLNGNSIPFTTETIKGIAYAFFNASTGNYVASYTVDSNPPVITNIVATPHINGTATITWDTDEASDSRVDYGIVANNLNQNTSDAPVVTNHSITLTGLNPGTTYYYRVTSVDGSGNSATSPIIANPPLSFIMPNVCALDQVTVDFSLGSTGSNTTVVAEGDGSVILKPVLTEDFSGSGLPVGWSSDIFNPGGTAIVNGGLATVDGAHIYSNSSFGPGSSIEFIATYNLGAFQNVGFSNDQPFNNNPWITIGQGSSPDANVYARSSSGTSVNLGALQGAPHHYRIKWNANSFEFFIDGSSTPSATIAETVGTGMYIQISDVFTAGAVLSVDWLRVTPYTASGSFTSRIFDRGINTNWGTAAWNSVEPSGTSLSVLARTGNTPVPDGSWTPFTALTNGVAVGANSRYIQYRADLATTDNAFTPVLEDVSIECTDGPDMAPPVITNIVATPAANGVTATITWNTNEGANSLVSYGTSPGSLTQTVSSATFVTSHSKLLSGLTPGTTYYFRVTSADPATNTAVSPNPPAAPLSFTTLIPICFEDITMANFSGGTATNTYFSSTDDGEVILKPAAASEFTTMPPITEWNSYPWGAGGNSSVSGGLLTVDGARFNTEPEATTYGPGTIMEFVATFSAASFQHIGFGGGTNLGGTQIYNGTPWIMFSTGTSGVLQARTHNGSSSSDFVIPGNFTGASHRYRIEWKPSVVDYYIDGSLVRSEPIIVNTLMRPAISDFTVGGSAVIVDWIQVTPFVSSGAFESRVYDAGGLHTWGIATWTADVPIGTTLKLFQRRGQTPVLTGPWTEMTNGASINGSSRYIQYRAEFTTTDATRTPVLKDAHISCTPCSTCAPLPVNLINLTATAYGKKVTVKWTTTSESNNRGFEVRRSTDGSTWSVIGFVNGAGTSTIARNYSYIDDNLAPKRYYYQLKQIDFDNNFLYSGIVSAKVTGSMDFALGQNLPNPFSGTAIIEFTLAEKRKVKLTLYDVQGRTVRVLVNDTRDAGTYTVTFNQEQISSGVYYYKMEAGEFTDVKKMIIQ